MNKFMYLYFLHFLNDGFESSFLLLLPFIAKDLHITLAQVGFLGTVESGIEILLSLPASIIAAKYGGFRTLIFALSIYTIGFFVTGFAPSILLLFITFMIAGAGFGIFNSIGLSLAAKWANQSSKGRQMGNYSSSGDIGKAGISTILPFLATNIGWRLTAISYSVVGFVVFFIFRRLASHVHKVEITAKKVKSISIGKVIKNKRFLLANATNFLDTLASGALFIFLPFLLLEKGLATILIGVFTAAYFLGTVSGKLFFGRITDIFDKPILMIAAQLAMGLCIILLAKTNQFSLILFLSFVLGAFSKGTVPISKIMIADSVAHHGNYEKAFGVNVIIASAAATLSPLMWGYVSNQFGIVMAFNVSALVTLLTIIPAIAYKFSR